MAMYSSLTLELAALPKSEAVAEKVSQDVEITMFGQESTFANSTDTLNTASLMIQRRRRRGIRSTLSLTIG